MATKPDATTAVSPNNPCPFLRALVAQGKLADDTEPLTKVAIVIVEVAKAGDGSPALPPAAIYAIAMIANGIGPFSVLNANLGGLKLNALRDGPLDKHGAGSGILDSQGKVDKKELARLGEFAKEKRDAKGQAEPGLALPELRAYMDANFARAAGRRRLVDRQLMNGEWPILLNVMGKKGKGGRYLSLKEVEELFTKRRLPARMGV
jgi:hypothetical protein